MYRKMRLRFCPGDVLAIAIVAALAVAVAVGARRFAQNGDDCRVLIYQYGTLICEAKIDEDRIIDIGGEFSNTVKISAGKVEMSQSNCPGQDCVHSGHICRAGQSIVCLPNRVEVRIEGRSDVDFVVK